MATVASAQPADGRGRGMMMGAMMSQAALLRQEAVQAELGVTADQKSKLTTVLPDRGPAGGNFRDMSDEDRRKWMEERRVHQVEDDQKIAALLEPRQLDRLKQIRVQALGARALMDDVIGKEIGVTEEQAKSLREAMEAMRGQGGGNPLQMRQEMYQKAVEMLSAEQKAKFEELRGPAFDLSKLQMRGPGGGRPGGGN